MTRDDSDRVVDLLRRQLARSDTGIRASCRLRAVCAGFERSRGVEALRVGPVGYRAAESGPFCKRGRPGPVRAAPCVSSLLRSRRARLAGATCRSASSPKSASGRPYLRGRPGSSGSASPPVGLGHPRGVVVDTCHRRRHRGADEAPGRARRTRAGVLLGGRGRGPSKGMQRSEERRLTFLPIVDPQGSGVEIDRRGIALRARRLRVRSGPGSACGSHAPPDHGGPDRFEAHAIEGTGGCAAMVIRSPVSTADVASLTSGRPKSIATF